LSETRGEGRGGADLRREIPLTCSEIRRGKGQGGLRGLIGAACVESGKV
jgi:hypothetical protein